MDNNSLLQNEITFDKAVRWVGSVLLIVAVGLLVNYLSGVLLPFFIGWLLAYLLYPLMMWIETRCHIRFRAISIIATMLIVLAVLSLLVYFIVPPMIEQFQKLYAILIHWMQSSTHTNNLSEWIAQWAQENRQTIERFFRSPDFTNTLKSVAPRVFSILGQTYSIVVSIVASLITLLYTFFILLDYEKLTKKWTCIFPKKYRPFCSELGQDVARELDNYVRGQGMVALCMGIMFCIGFTIMDFPMAIGLGILIGLMDLVPYLHTFALIPTAFLAMLKSAETGQNFWLVFGLAVGLFCLVQVITDMIVTPKIMGKMMGLNPAILLLSLSVWGALMGFIGLIIALPLTTLIIAYWKRYVTRENEEENTLLLEEKASESSEK